MFLPKSFPKWIAHFNSLIDPVYFFWSLYSDVSVVASYTDMVYAYKVYCVVDVVEEGVHQQRHGLVGVSRDVRADTLRPISVRADLPGLEVGSVRREEHQFTGIPMVRGPWVSEAVLRTKMSREWSLGY